MGYTARDAYDTVQVEGPNLQYPATVFTIQTDGGWIVLRTVAKGSTGVQTKHELLSSLADGVDNLIGGGYAIAAAGVQDIDSSNLLYDAVRFTVAYDLPTPPGGQLTTDVDVRVEFVSFAVQGGPNPTTESLARDQLQAAADELRTLATG